MSREINERIAAFASEARVKVYEAVGLLSFKETGTWATGHAQSIRRQLVHAQRELAMLEKMVKLEGRK